MGKHLKSLPGRSIGIPQPGMHPSAQVSLEEPCQGAAIWVNQLTCESGVDLGALLSSLVLLQGGRQAFPCNVPLESCSWARPVLSARCALDVAAGLSCTISAKTPKSWCSRAVNVAASRHGCCREL